MPNRYKKVIAENRKAFFDYTIIETYQAGIVLKGTEVKSIRSGEVNLKDSFGRIENGEIWLFNMHLSPYKQGGIYNLEPTRQRKLLMRKNEMNKLIGKVQEKGLTLIPLKIYLMGNWVKVDLALAKSKKMFEKREKIKKKETAREVARAFSELDEEKMIKEKQDDHSAPSGSKKTYTVHDLMEATKEILKNDEIGKKLPDSAIANLTKLLTKTALKGDL